MGPDRIPNLSPGPLDCQHLRSHRLLGLFIQRCIPLPWVGLLFSPNKGPTLLFVNLRHCSKGRHSVSSTLRWNHEPTTHLS